MHLNGQSIRSCSTPIITAAGQEITTIEGIFVGETLHVDQQAWVDEQVPQCGYCQSGQIISVVALLTSNSNPTDEEIDQAMSGNICRRHTCSRIRKGIKFATMRLNENLTVERNG